MRFSLLVLALTQLNQFIWSIFILFYLVTGKVLDLTYYLSFLLTSYHINEFDHPSSTSKYRSVIVSNGASPVEPQFDDTVTHIIRCECHKFQSDTQTSFAPTRLTDSKEGGGFQTQYENCICFHCGQKGHPVSRCPELRTKCFNCGKERHVSGRCPEPAAPAAPAPDSTAPPVFLSLSSLPPEIMVDTFHEFLIVRTCSMFVQFIKSVAVSQVNRVRTVILMPQMSSLALSYVLNCFHPCRAYTYCIVL